jgi:uncharacterized RDD family membrane protein YckC
VTVIDAATFGFLAIPALTFALAYFPVVAHLARGLVSPYAKVDVRKRMLAAAVDGALVATCVAFYRLSGATAFLVAGAAYLILRDAVGGQSVGKFLCGLVVISLETGRPTNWSGSVRRNLIFALPGANVVAVFLEAMTIVRDPQGQRLGDRLAQTQVVDGLDAKAVARALMEWWQDVAPEVARAARPKRAPALPAARYGPAPGGPSVEANAG